MSNYGWTILVTLVAFFLSRGRARVPFSLAYLFAKQLFNLPGILERGIQKKYRQRFTLSLKICPSCGAVSIRSSDCICASCKLEVSLGRDIVALSDK
ncbi:hypothetical protein SAMN02745866_00865 [Alteromonadaceae bacterium Bs31]|nr:hypothetical protein SAMN02745866_00865 [Alteromonadaceae bacterium Bs31]